MQKIVKNEKGSVALFVLLTALFFLVVVTGVSVSFKNKEALVDSHIEKVKQSYEKDATQVYKEAISTPRPRDKDKNGVEIAGTDETIPFLPGPSKCIITNNDLSTGLTIKDEDDNEWVWIEVPKSVTSSATTDEQIKDALRSYCSDIFTDGIGTYEDTWYNGCGLSQSEYNTAKGKMLNCIKNNGGFYIGKYETGIIDESIASNATYVSGFRTSGGNTTQPAAIIPNLQPYTYLTCEQATTLAKDFAKGGKTSSLLFGIQWDLVLKYLKVKENLTNSVLTGNSESWGNYDGVTYNITNTNAWYSTNYGANWTKGPYNNISGGEILLTTGAINSFMKQNIYDFAGNVGEWTLEYSGNSSYKYVYRGGAYEEDEDNPASDRTRNTGLARHYIGFRVTLY